MHHSSKTNRTISYLSLGVLGLYFALLGFGSIDFTPLLFIGLAWFSYYGVILSKNENTSLYYKLFILIVIFNSMIGLAMFLFIGSSVGFQILTLQAVLLSLIITLAKKETSSLETQD